MSFLSQTAEHIIEADLSSSTLDPDNAIWTPDALGKTYWDWDASVLTSITKDGSNNVSAWADVKNGLIMTLPSTYTPPVYSASAWLGQPGIVFAGDANLTTGCLLDCAGPLGPKRTVFAVLQRDTQNDDATSGLRKIVSLHVGNPSGSNGYAVFLAANRPTTDPAQSNLIIGGIGTATRTITGLNVGSKAIVYGSFDSDADSGRSSINDGTQSSSAVMRATTNSARWAIGGLVGSKQAFKGTFRRVIIINDVLTDDQRQKMFGYLAWYEGISGVLYDGHPYSKDGPYVS